MKWRGEEGWVGRIMFQCKLNGMLKFFSLCTRNMYVDCILE